MIVPSSDWIASKEKNSETHIQEMEEELKLLKNHSQPNIFLLDEEGKWEEMLAVISEEAGALATADGNQELKLKCF